MFSVHKHLTLNSNTQRHWLNYCPFCKWVQLYNTLFTAIMFIYNAKSSEEGNKEMYSWGLKKKRLDVEAQICKWCSFRGERRDYKKTVRAWRWEMKGYLQQGHQRTGQHRYIPHRYLHTTYNQTVKTEDTPAESILNISVHSVWYFLCDCTKKTLVGSDVTHIKGPTKTRGVVRLERPRLTFRISGWDRRGNETEMSVWEVWCTTAASAEKVWDRLWSEHWW